MSYMRKQIKTAFFFSHNLAVDSVNMSETISASQKVETRLEWKTTVPTSPEFTNSVTEVQRNGQV